MVMGNIHPWEPEMLDITLLLVLRRKDQLDTVLALKDLPTQVRKKTINITIICCHRTDLFLY